MREATHTYSDMRWENTCWKTAMGRWQWQGSTSIHRRAPAKGSQLGVDASKKAGRRRDAGHRSRVADRGRGEMERRRPSEEGCRRMQDNKNARR
ncbi:hypothetical protein L227DRAFT_329870 [Lentinus tigrinus ALCF2SS1-6]|uniref:Uncharacterized protein n=1 Tax=Lentinus tigrinus ALCF2SS1-6 TaxID=1328759 RepID=A0A5C2SSZ7_9APHY|nr:hypothetical protein L227DRAFT_329870 [Lentinus tigrinus ALCF2SS1-6]